ncbi:uncharacterized protein LOC105168477 isoform X3 [Sesamum indicum]|uniref:Uncharacterized protein LOC105168477 isoform X3 n=1 Tax=Sesamum indicum TaxID=4182 RepID=A0A6I9TLV5_SESIN|nr:uncharacterized protein LOC105168477 isoform X3 [Sesamum indicum]
MVERFFYKRQPNFQLPEPPHPITLLSGPPSCGKTSLLFQFALNSAAESNGAVVILCNRRRLETCPPFLSQGVDPSSELFQRIQMKYVDDDEGIKNYFAAFHLHDTFPVSVIIDDFADFFNERTCQERYNNPRGRDLAMVRVLALCRNAIDHFNKRGACELLFSDTHKGDSLRLLYIYRRWVSCIYTIQKGDGVGSFILKKSYSDTANTKRTRSARYSVALQNLVLEDLLEEVEC